MSHWVNTSRKHRSAASFMMLCILLLGSFPASGSWECLDGTPCSSSMPAAQMSQPSPGAGCSMPCCRKSKTPMRSCCGSRGKKMSPARARSAAASNRCVCRLQAAHSRQMAPPQVWHGAAPVASLHTQTSCRVTPSTTHLTKFVEVRGPPSYLLRTASLRAPPAA